MAGMCPLNVCLSVSLSNGGFVTVLTAAEKKSFEGIFDNCASFRKKESVCLHT